jgi:CubicO group peptidase (beta-lactamase class C family)
MMMSLKQKYLISVLVIIILVPQLQLSERYEMICGYNRDYWPTEEWKTAQPSEVGMNSSLLNELLNHLDEEAPGLDGLVVIKNGYLIVNEYFTYWNENRPHIIYSCTKSVTSAAVGIAIDQGHFTIDDYVLDFFPNRTFSNVDDRKRNITVMNLLQMQTGFEWDEWTLDYTNPLNDHKSMQFSDDYIQFILDKPMAHDPGTVFNYCGGASHLLSVIIQKSVNMTTWEFINRFLFEPIGITPGSYLTSPDNVFFGAHGLHLTPLDMAKFGYLYLNNGTWNGIQMVPKSWIIDSTRQYNPVGKRYGFPIYYGYQWWVYEESYQYFDFLAVGYLGQRIHCFPELDLIVVVASSSNVNRDYFFNDYIIPAINGNKNSSVSYNFFSSVIGISLLAALFLRLKHKGIRK